MKQIRILSIVLGALGVLALSASPAFAQSGGDTGGDGPPFGLKIQGAAKGTKLSGPLAIVAIAIDAEREAAELQVSVRLRQGSLAKTFAGLVTPEDVRCDDPDDEGDATIPCSPTGVPLDLAGAIQDAIITVLGPAVVDFFGCADCELTLKDGDFDGDGAGIDFPPLNEYYISDVVLAMAVPKE